MKYITFLFIAFGIQINNAQNNTIDNLRLGFGVTLTAEIQNGYHLKFRASAAGGIGQYLAVNNNGFGALPTTHLGIMVYNRGILGSQLDKEYKNSVFLDFFADATFTVGGKNITEINRLEDRLVTLYHFADFTANPLQNTFKHSLSFGLNLILNPDKNREAQMVGFFNLNVARTAQISYYNDGGPVLNLLGDGKDRYYTGGFVLSAHLKTQTYINLIELSFHKFTGWQPLAFDASDKLQLDHIPYKNKDVFGFNQQQWKLAVHSFNHNFSAYVSAYDVNVWDVQDILHFSRDNPYHPDYFYGFRIAIGGAYESFNYKNQL
ncbi:hypothetical protein [Lacinutrix sp. Bg11-31]|uniref:hypothetical protein n=1 Tax=Lacinutrix sp. Bg11-31 TaxID=2057808 RepID=UPI000C303350|nr:hypothetical protein [Lacinutrix sp. Bg11-31]AUC81478.1 hypothetical protein CW733_04775 [Lacinutrix sp. Bg11-31]